MPAFLLPLLVGAAKGAAVGGLAGGALSEATGGDFEDGLKKGALTGAATGGIGSGISELVSGGGQAAQGAANAADVASGIETAGSSGSETLAQAGQLSAQTAPAGVGETSMEIGSQISGLTESAPSMGDKMLNFGKDVGKDTAKSMATSFAVDKMTPDPTMYGGLPDMPDMAPPQIMQGSGRNKALEIMKGHLR